MLPRPVLFVGRVVLWGAIGLLLVRGVIDIARPDDDKVNSVGAARAEDGIDMTGAEAFAVRFTSDYLTVDESNPARWREALAGYLADDVDASRGWNEVGVQSVLEAVPVRTTTGDDGRAVVTVAARLTSGEWIHLDVPLAGDGPGFVVTGLPAVLPAPAVPGDIGAGSFEADPDLTGQLRPLVESFFSAYGDGEPTELDRWLAPGHQVIGLGGAFTLSQVEELAVADADDNQALARATVRWTGTDTDVSFGSTYDLTLVQQGGRWYVERLAALGG